MTAVFFLTVIALSAGPPNIVLISADTLRADKLGCYGYPSPTSAAIDKFARESIVFEDCICEVPLTTPSFGAMLTSMYPRATGVTRNGMRMPNNIQTFPQSLQKAGYQTVCVQSNWPLKKHICGFDRGFDIYEDGFREKRWGFMLPERDAKQVTDLSLKFLAERDMHRPFFFWVHYSDPHAPYRLHKEFNPSGRKIWRLNSIDRIRAKYDSEVAYMDFHVGRLLEAVPRENTVIIFTADHGESLYEHGYLGHGRRIYQDNQHVPLIIGGTGIEPGRVKSPVCIIDVAPTLLGLANISPAPEMLGLDILNGTVPENRVRFIETYGGAVPRLPGARLFMAERHPMRQGLILQTWKFIIGGQGPELYRLDTDPAEKKNLASQENSRIEDFVNRISAWTKRLPEYKGEPAALSREDIQALESLGYLE